MKSQAKKIADALVIHKGVKFSKIISKKTLDNSGNVRYNGIIVNQNRKRKICFI